MKVTDEMLAKMAKLARLKVKEEEKDKLKADLTQILDWVEKLKEVDTEGVEPLIHMTDEINRLREDVVENQLTQAQALSNAPESDGEFFRVPKVINPKDE